MFKEMVEVSGADVFKTLLLDDLFPGPKGILVRLDCRRRQVVPLDLVLGYFPQGHWPWFARGFHEFFASFAFLGEVADLIDLFSKPACFPQSSL